ncbi:hypothetical protein D3C81_382460 [compost metagenome]
MPHGTQPHSAPTASALKGVSIGINGFNKGRTRRQMTLPAASTLARPRQASIRYRPKATSIRLASQ